MVSINLNDYAALMKKLVDEEISIKKFEAIFLDFFLHKENKLTSKEYEIVNDLFYAVEDFVDEEFIKEHGLSGTDIDGRTLRIIVFRILQNLKNIE
ncbi:MAG: colicin immunity domain-containing protein [Streptococcaceae bacterium]|jgi:hypothetical protein|nr:colicin immunity domain-containing protein [Streptococcaceae bacterium]